MAGNGDGAHIDTLITIAENRKDAVVFASPERSDVVGIANQNNKLVESYQVEVDKIYK